MSFIVFILFGFVFCDDIVMVSGTPYTTLDLFNRYNKQDWDRSTQEEKLQMVKDFSKHIVIEKEAVDMGFLLKPDVAIKIKNRSDMLIVNAVYEELVAKPLINKEDYNLALKNIKKEFFVSHILIGHSKSRLREAPKRNKDDAFLLAQDIQKQLWGGVEFDFVVEKYSDDPSAVNNNGVLGWIGWGRTIPSFQNIVFNLDVGDISQPILTDFGYHVVLVDSIRSSSLVGLSDEQLEFAAYNTCKGLIQHKLRPAAQKFDSLQLKKVNLVFNEQGLNSLVNYIKEEEDRVKLANQYNIDVVGLLGGDINVGVLCVYNNKGLGPKWFAKQLEKIPRSRRPRLFDVPSIKVAFETIILQDNARVLAVARGVNNSYYYKKQVQEMTNSILYDSFFKWVVNTSKKPDSLDVKNYYNKNMETKYKEPEKVSVREIRVGTRDLADSLFLELEYGVDFVGLAKKFSKSNPHKGGLIQPFSRGKYNEMGAVAFSLSIGSYSNVIENLDRSYSIVYVEGFIDEKISPLDKVYVRIETLLTKEHQERAKTDVVKMLNDKYNVRFLLELEGV